jgi:hypothetical protein
MIIAFSLVALPSPAWADVEKFVTACDDKMCFHWWPKLPALQGWHQDRDNSLYYSFNALAPEGKSFSDAETVIYAKAVYKPRVPDAKTLASFVERDMQTFRSEYPDLKITEEAPLKTADGNTVRLFRFVPASNGQWECVAYLEEGDYYMDFVISSRSEKGLADSSADYEMLIASYKEKL